MATFQRDAYSIALTVASFAGTGNRTVNFTSPGSAIATTDLAGNLVAKIGAGADFQIGNTRARIAQVNSATQITLAEDWTGATTAGQSATIWAGTADEALIAGILQALAFRGTAANAFPAFTFDDGTTRFRFITESGLIKLYVGATKTGSTETATVLAWAIDPATGVYNSSMTILSALAAAFAVGANGATNPAFLVDASTASSATGWRAKSRAAGAGADLSVISSGTNEDGKIDAKGSGQVKIATVSTGGVRMDGNVGIGMAPTYKLDVLGTGRFGTGSGGQYVRVNGGPTGSASGAAVLFELAGSFDSAFGHKSAIQGGAHDRTMMLYVAGGGTMEFTAGTQIQLFVTGGNAFVPNGSLGVGISSSPAATLDVNGSVAFRSGTLTVANGLNSNLATPAFSSIRAVGATGAFSIGGLTGGVDGRVVRIYNTLAQTMTIVNEDASSTAGNRITTLTGANIVLRATAKSHVTLRYDATDSRWIVEGTN